MRLLRTLWKNWRRFGRWMGDQVARVVLTVFYFSLALPFGIGIRLAADVLGKKPAPAWLPKDTGEAALDSARNLF